MSNDQSVADSWYEASRNDPGNALILSGEINADVVVIGGGITGASTCLHLAEQGVDVILIEANQLGWGASGRSGGQLITGYAAEQSEIAALTDPETAQILWQHSLDAVQLARDQIARHQIDCDLRHGYLHVADSPAKAEKLQNWCNQMDGDYGYQVMEYLDSTALGTELGTTRYHGAVSDPGSGHLHPLNYTLGLLRAAAAAGARIFHHSPVLNVELNTASKVVVCADGKVNCDQVVYCCNAYINQLESGLSKYIMPVGTYIIATEPLGQTRAAAIITGDAAVADTNFVLDYYRLSADFRLLFGGRVSYSTLEPVRLKRSLQRRMLRVFPQLDDIEIEFAWGGYVAITRNRLPHISSTGTGVWAAQGFSGHGIALTGYAGKLLAEAVQGNKDNIEAFTTLKHRKFPGGSMLRTPALVAGMAYHRLLDKVH